MSAVELQNIEIVERQPVALPMATWAATLVGLWPVGIVIAYLERAKASAEMAAQYRYLIRTCWIGVLYGCVASVLCLFLVGYVLLFALTLWWIARCVKAMIGLARHEPPRHPGTWLV